MTGKLGRAWVDAWVCAWVVHGPVHGLVHDDVFLGGFMMEDT